MHSDLEQLFCGFPCSILKGIWSEGQDKNVNHHLKCSELSVLLSLPSLSPTFRHSGYKDSKMGKMWREVLYGLWSEMLTETRTAQIPVICGLPRDCWTTSLRGNDSLSRGLLGLNSLGVPLNSEGIRCTEKFNVQHKALFLLQTISSTTSVFASELPLCTF